MGSANGRDDTFGLAAPPLSIRFRTRGRAGAAFRGSEHVLRLTRFPSNWGTWIVDGMRACLLG